MRLTRFRSGVLLHQLLVIFAPAAAGASMKRYSTGNSKIPPESYP